MFLPEFENILNVSLNVPESERMRSEILNTGYDPGSRVWELIIRYSDYPEYFFEQYPQVSSIRLLGNYAVVRVPENLLEELAQTPGVIYVELPKRLYFGENIFHTMAVDSVQASGTSGILERLGGNLTGSGVLVGVADSGIDVTHPAFRNRDGSTRIAALWDQASGEYSREDINAFLNEWDNRKTAAANVNLRIPEAFRDLSGHGTAVAGIAAGSRQVIELRGFTVVQGDAWGSENARGDYARGENQIGGDVMSIPGYARGVEQISGDVMPIQGYAPDAELVVVKLAQNRTADYARAAGQEMDGGNDSAGAAGGIPTGTSDRLQAAQTAMQNGADNYVRTTRLMQAADYLVRKAGELGKPMAINLSIGNNYGSHSGRSLLSTYLSELALSERVTICAGSGNEAGKPIHVSGKIGNETDLGRDREILLAVAERQVSFSIQIWKKYEDILELHLTAPGGETYRIYYDEDLLQTATPLRRFRTGRSDGTQVLVYNGQPSPYQPYQEIFIDLIPDKQYVDSGIWKLEILPVRIVTGEVELWLPAGATLNRGTGFAMPDADRTLTVPSTADRVITVGAIDSRNQTYAAFSGRGYTAFTGQVKPDLAAPGVDVLAPRAGTAAYGEFTGTSFAAPAVTGAAALLMQWGIVEGNDPWLYGSRLKSWFHRNVRQIGAFTEYPNPYVGYGIL